MLLCNSQRHWSGEFPGLYATLRGAPEAIATKTIPAVLSELHKGVTTFTRGPIQGWVCERPNFADVHITTELSGIKGIALLPEMHLNCVAFDWAAVAAL